METVVFDAPIYSFREQWSGSRICRQRAAQASLIHFPHYNAPWLLPRHSVVTVHDLTHFELAPLFARSRVLLARLVLGRAARRAGALIAVSQATRKALEARFPAARGKTTVIHHGVDACFRPLEPDAVAAFRQREGLGRCFVCVTADRPHKNLPRLLGAFAELRRAVPSVELAIVGARPLESGRAAEGVRVVSDLADDELALWYNAADALVLPSLNEGFGLPALEAMAGGTPVIGSDIEALREVVGDAGLLVDPHDEAAWVRALRRLLDHPQELRELSQRSLTRAGGFSWSAAARRTLEVYASVARPTAATALSR